MLMGWTPKVAGVALKHGVRMFFLDINASTVHYLRPTYHHFKITAVEIRRKAALVIHMVTLRKSIL